MALNPGQGLSEKEIIAEGLGALDGLAYAGGTCILQR